MAGNKSVERSLIFIELISYVELHESKLSTDVILIAPSRGLLNVKTLFLIFFCSKFLRYSDCIPSSPGTTKCSVLTPSSALIKVSLTFGKKSTYSTEISLSKKSSGSLKLLLEIAERNSFLS